MLDRALRVLLAGSVTAGFLAGVPSGAGVTGSGTATISPVADAYVSSAAPQRNFGEARSLKVSASPVAVAYLRFRIAVPPGRTVTRATLQLFASAKSAAGFTVHRVASTTWGERTIDYASVPPLQSAVVASSGPYRGNGYVSVDVTPLFAGSGVVSLAVRSVSAAPLVFNSREAAARRPRLVVGTAATGTGARGDAACGTATASRGVQHVIWIWMENKGYDSVIGSPSAPFENQLAASCGLAANYHGVSHPSLPNYIAATSGGTQGITDDEPPSAHPLDVASIYSQVKAAGKTWRDYEEGAPGNCPLASSGLYAVRHDPAPYFTGIRGDCAAWDVPMGTTAGGNFLADLTSGTLPAFSFVTPDLCHDTHDCPVATGDDWLKAWFGKILASPAYRAGGTVVFVVWDEDEGSPSNHIPLIVVSPSTVPGTQAATSFDHYALLKTTEQLLGLPSFLGHAGDAGTPSMTAAFDLG